MSKIAKILEIRPGRVAALFPSALAETDPDSAGVETIQNALNTARNSDVLFVQSLVQPGDERAIRLLQSCGFSCLTDVLYLVCPRLAFPSSTTSGDLHFIAFDESAEMNQRLSQLVLRTYEDSRDCQQLNGWRSVEDALASYRAVGRYDPQHCSIVQRENADIGCLLLAEHPTENQWEIVYMGVLPQFRGQGLGLKLVRHAQSTAAQFDASQLSTAVDGANGPALAIYRAAGFEMAAKHRLYLRNV